MRNYIILRRWYGTAVWEQITAQYARNPQAAVRQARVGHEEELAEHVAIPVHSWKIIRSEPDEIPEADQRKC